VTRSRWLRANVIGSTAIPRKRDFLYVTMANLNQEQLQALSDEVGAERSLLVVCSALAVVRRASAGLHAVSSKTASRNVKS
jgi:hypothetical protein